MIIHWEVDNYYFLAVEYHCIMRYATKVPIPYMLPLTQKISLSVKQYFSSHNVHTISEQWRSAQLHNL